ncbi:hypothetical protein VaNZ11_002289 [Volvox africanus]|uniref:Potassium transporter n=1 Tax=Volvox africanus TaxID=51714 RepID=A0ABQ5RRS3_9CHLO|nr:hypothetical protein VaNZ11_002289 [Volvox africanus]
MIQIVTNPPLPPLPSPPLLQQHEQKQEQQEEQQQEQQQPQQQPQQQEQQQLGLSSHDDAERSANAPFESLVSNLQLCRAMFPRVTASETEAQLPDHILPGREKLSWAAFAALSWSSIGVIFGDIATSPLYVFVSVFQDLRSNGPPQKSDVLGATSLIFWTLTLVVLVKYIGVVLRADDQGQGGTFALYSLLCRTIGIKPHGTRGSHVPHHNRRVVGAEGTAGPKAAIERTCTAPGSPDVGPADVVGPSESDGDSSTAGDGGDGRRTARRAWWQYLAADKRKVHAWFRRSRRAQVGLWGVSVVATAMLIGDGVLTPAISVLSAVSGLRVVAPSLGQEVVVAVTIAILCLVFAMQQMGTGQVGRFFAPVIALWLLANAAINVYNIARHGGAVFAALNPAHIGVFFARHGAEAWRSLGSVMLCVTGAEALFADLGHFSRESISVAFGLLAYPCLVVTYLGQAAHVIAHPENTDAFWASLPSKLLYPMLVLATLAAIVASQALISGVFSIVRQAMILGAFPPVRVVHTGGKDIAAATQVYVPLANAVLFLLCCVVVGGFQDTVALGKAYGLAVMTDMMTTTCFVALVMLAVWGVSLLLLLPFLLLFLVVEGAYWSANIIKVPEGGWFTLAVALGVAFIMLVWWAGSRRLGERLAAVTDGAAIRLLNIPQPPPLLVKPPLPPPPPPKPSIGTVSFQRLFSRFSLGRSTGRRDGGSGISATSAPLPYTEVPYSGAPSNSRGLRRFSSTCFRSLKPQLQHQQRMVAVAAPGGPLDVATVPYAGSNVSPVRRQVLESHFPPGTLALVLPPDIPAAEVAGFQFPAPREDAEMGRPSRGGRTEEDPSLTPVSPSAPSVVIPLTVRLAGIGVYYMDEKVGGANGGLTALPPVLIHFMRNVHAIHDVCVFLSVRRLPTPSIPRRNRLHIYTPHSATPPNFYQVVAHYGYLDQINHGSAFISELLDAILKRLVAAVSVVEGRGDREKVWSGTLLQSPGSTIIGGDGSSPRGGSAADDAGPRRRVGGHQRKLSAQPLARRGQHNPTVSLQMPSVAAPPPPQPPQQQPMPPDGVIEEEGSTDTKLNQSGAGGEHQEVGGQDVGPYIGGGGGGRDRAQGYPGCGSERRSAEAEEKDGPRTLLPFGVAPRCSGGITTATAASAGLGSDIRSCVEETVAAFLEARLHGVVYYASRALIRATPPADSSPLTQLFQWLVYGLVFRFLAAISYVDMESWQVPADQLVELGMEVDIGGVSPDRELARQLRGRG